ncbi:MAG TPA: hypothetical protein VIY47_14255, partial [Ignavibacteriaceae bacterium]
FYRMNRNIYNLLENDNVPTGIKATNNSLDNERRRMLTDQSKAVNDISINKIEKDKYVAESLRIMQDCLQ